VVPAGVAATKSLLHVQVAEGTSPAAAPRPPYASGPPGAATSFSVEETRDGFTVEVGLRGTQYYVSLSVWLDTNGNARVDRGDAVGSVGPVFAEDRGLLRGNLTTTAPIALSLVP
jgi:hypothetical protein